MTNTNKLKGRIVEKGYTLARFSDILGLSRPAFRKKINNAADFRSSEIERICALLDISRIDIADYFFAAYVPKKETYTKGGSNERI